MSTLRLLRANGETADVALNDSGAYTRPTAPLQSRVAYAAAHVVPKVHADNTPGQPADIDWDATLAFRRNVYSWGSGSPTPWTPRSGTWAWMPQPPAS